MADHESHDKIYMKVFVALCVFTLLSAIADVFKGASPGVVGVVVLAIAAAKAACVMLFFMHLKWERGWKYVLLAPTTILAIGFPIALMPDIGWSYYHRVPTETMIEAGHDNDSHGATATDNGDH
jgi:cytochrome c oxidase subunit 4